MKKLVYLIVLIVALGLIISGCLSTVPPTEQDDLNTLTKQAGVTYYVNANTGNDIRTAEEAKDPNTPWLTIQHAVDTVPAESNINVAAGIYEENVAINESVTLQGYNRETTEIKFGYGSYPSLQPLVISADGVTVSGFTIRSGPYVEKDPFTPAVGGYAHTIIVDGDSALFTDLHVIKEPLFWPNGSPRIGGSAFWLAPSLNGFTLTDSTVESEWNGIYTREGSSNIVVRNVDFTYPGEYAIFLKTITGATIEDNTFTCTGHSILSIPEKHSDGIIITRGSNGIEIRGNQFVGSQPVVVSHIGILLQTWAPFIMGDVDILNNEISSFNTGILVEDVATSGTSIHYNNISSNAYGVNYLGSDTVDATCNWWGDASGPSCVGPGIGDAVSDNVEFWPWLLTPDLDGFCGIEVEIDIKLGSDPNSINLNSKGVVPVAVLTTGDFDASTIDPTTVEFAGASPVRWTMEDVDDDGNLDMLFHFKTQELDLDEYSEEAVLIGETWGGILIEGTDIVNIVPKNRV